MNAQKDPVPKIKIVADITLETQALLVKLLARNKAYSKVGLISRLIEEEAERQGIK